MPVRGEGVNKCDKCVRGSGGEKKTQKKKAKKTKQTKKKKRIKKQKASLKILCASEYTSVESTPDAAATSHATVQIF